MNVIKRILICIILTISAAFLLNYIFLPAWSVHSIGFWIYLAAVAIIFLILSAWLLKFRSARVLWIFGIYFAVFFILIIHGEPIFSANKYMAIADIENGGFLADAFAPITDISQLDILSMGSAGRVGDRVLGEMSQKYISQFEVNNEYNLINIDATPQRVTPLEYGGFFKYLNNKSAGIPAYLSVNVTNQTASLVELGDTPIKYSPSAFFGNNLKRHLRSIYPTKIFGKAQFELDDNGIPHYIVPTKKPAAGLFGALTVNGTILLNASTGETQYYDIGSVPIWVDHVYSVSDIMEMTKWHYYYIHGYINPSKKDMRTTSFDYDSSQYYSLAKYDDIYVSTGITSVGSDESNVGFILANLRTGKITYYDDAGAEESSAQGSAQGLVQQFGYIAAPPKLVNIDGVSTYYMPLYDSQGVFRKHAFVCKSIFTKAVEADSLQDAFDKYRKLLETEIPKTQAETTGTIIELYSATMDGNTYFYFKLEGDNNFYVSSITNNPKQVTLTVGDTVNVIFEQDTQNDTVVVTQIELM